MKSFLLLLTVCIFFSATDAYADADCGKASDACKPQPVTLTPFMADLKKAAGGPALKQEPAKDTKTNDREPAAPPEVSAPAADAAAASEPPVVKKTFSRPGWMVAAALFMSGLYYFLKEGKKRRGKR
jgi:hypothetical protein